MKKTFLGFWLFLAIFGLSHCSKPQSSSVSVEPKGDFRIGGSENVWIEPHLHPVIPFVYQASQGNICTGFLIHERVVITAAHCTLKETPWVGFGYNAINRAGTHWVKPAKAIIHPWYQPGSKYRNRTDLALLILPHKAFANQPNWQQRYDEITQKLTFSLQLAVEMAHRKKDSYLWDEHKDVGVLTLYGWGNQNYDYNTGRSWWDGQLRGALFHQYQFTVLEIILNYDPQTKSPIPQKVAYACGGDSGGPIFRAYRDQNRRWVLDFVGVQSLVVPTKSQQSLLCSEMVSMGASIGLSLEDFIIPTLKNEGIDLSEKYPELKAILGN